MQSFRSFQQWTDLKNRQGASYGFTRKKNTEPAAFTNELFQGFYAQQTMTEILFSGNQSAVLPVRIDEGLRAYIHQQFPNVGKELDMALTYHILGSYYVFQQYYKAHGVEQTLQFIANMSKAVKL